MFQNICIISYDFTPVNKFKSESVTCVLNDSVIKILIEKKCSKIISKKNYKPLKHVLEFFENWNFPKSENTGKSFVMKNWA